MACQDGAERTDERRAVSARPWPCHVRTSRGSPCRTLCLQTILSQLSRAPVSTRKIRAQRSVYRGASRPSSTVSTRRPRSLPLLLLCGRQLPPSNLAGEWCKCKGCKACDKSKSARGPLAWLPPPPGLAPSPPPQPIQWCNNATLRMHIERVQATNLWRYVERSSLPLPWADVAKLRSFRTCMGSVSTGSTETSRRPDLWYEKVNSSKHLTRTITWWPGRTNSSFQIARGGGLECNSRATGVLPDAELARPTQTQREWYWSSEDAFHPTNVLPGDTADADSVLVLRRTLKGARILLLGDSLTRQQFYSLVCLLDSYGVAPDRVTYPECHSSCAILMADEPDIALLLRSHNIVLAEGASHHLDKMGGNAQFFFVLERLLRALALREVSTRGPMRKSSGVWLRTRCPRHFTKELPHPVGPLCHNITRPPPEALKYSTLEDYHSTPAQNCALHNMLDSAVPRGVHVRTLETEALSFHRADQHPIGPSAEARGVCDLSHWCAAGSGPSVPDTWNLLWLKQLTIDYLR